MFDTALVMNLCSERPNKRTADNRAVTFWFHAQRLGRAVPECERWLRPEGRLNRFSQLLRR